MSKTSNTRRSKRSLKKLVRTDTDSSLCGRRPKYDYTHYLFNGDLEEEQAPPLPELASRTTLLLHDYKRFLAARTIQTRARAWYVRYRFEIINKAAITIQTSWRRFYAQRYYYCLLEKEVEKAIEAYYNKMATRIQSLWRGWWVRENVHDQSRLSRMQVFAAEDLLYCVAFKLHHLLRTYHIPGVYSLKNSNCLSRVEKLLNSMSFKQHNDRVRKARARRLQEINEAQKAFQKSAHGTCIPYAGPNMFGFCDPICEKIYMDSDADTKLNRILAMYEETVRDPLAQKFKNKISKKLREKLRNLESPSDFCTDVIKSMKRWKIINEKKLKIPNDIFKTPENVEHFLTEAESILNLMEERCACKYKVSRRICDTPEESVIC